MTPKPPSVKVAVLLMFIALSIGQARSLLDFSNAVREAAPVGGIYTVIAVQVLVLAFSVAVALLINNRKNWARIFFLLFVGLGGILAIVPLFKSFQTDLFQAMAGLLQMALQVSAAVLLLRRESRTWFSQK